MLHCRTIKYICQRYQILQKESCLVGGPQRTGRNERVQVPIEGMINELILREHPAQATGPSIQEDEFNSRTEYQNFGIVSHRIRDLVQPENNLPPMA